jgi:DNA-3-methyladenine glycosylase II
MYQYDPARALSHLRRADPALARIIKQVGAFKMELKRSPDVFGALSQSIVYQQLSGKAAATIYGRFCALFGADVKWPTPDQVIASSEEQLRGAGLSRAKMAAVLDLANKIHDGTVPALDELGRQSDREIIDCLSQVRGVGHWTAEMFLIFRLGRPDVLPIDDLGVRKGFKVTYGLSDLPDKHFMLDQASCWSPYRSVGTWYMWRAAELPD